MKNPPKPSSGGWKLRTLQANLLRVLLTSYLTAALSAAKSSGRCSHAYINCAALHSNLLARLESERPHAARREG